MSNPVQIFVHERFGKVRVVMIEGEPHFVAADVCKALDIKNYRDAVARLNDDEKKLAMIPVGGVGLNDTQGNYQSVNVVNEPGLYRLIFASRKPEARDFQDWVYHEVLPSIRKTGSYSLFDKPAAKKKPRKSHAVIFGCAFVYVFLLSNGLVKIGCSGNPRTRAAEIERKTGLTIKRVYLSLCMPRSFALLVEWRCQKNFSSKRVTGEIFSVDFERACATVEDFATAEAVQLVSKLNIATVNLSAAEKFK